MDEALDLHILRNMFADLANFLQGQLPRRYHALRALFIPEKERPVVCIICLCADMDLHLRENASGNLKNTRIGNNQRIRLDFFQFCEIFFHTG